MALATFKFDAKDMGDASSMSTSYIAELVSCSNTTVPITINGYVFKTTLNNAPKTGKGIEVNFNDVPANTIIPSSYKLKITGVKNGNQIIRYGDCFNSQLVICAEEDNSTCAINNVSIAQPSCSSGRVTQPYSFSTNHLGLHKLQLYRIYGSGQPSVIVKEQNVNVTNLSILQTGTLILDSLDTDNYKLYISAITESSEEALCLGTSSITLLGCDDASICVKPTFNLSFENPSCDGLATLANGKLIIKNVVNGNKVQICRNQVWNCVDDFSKAIDINNTTEFTAAQGLDLSTGDNFVPFVVRVYKNSTCYTDKVVKLTKPECNVDICSLPNVDYSGQSIVKEYSYKNTTNQAQRIYLRFEPSTPVSLIVSRDGTALYNSNCSGINTTNCANCTQGGVICASLFLNAGQIANIKINSLCSNNATTAWKLKTSCAVITECTTSIKIGEPNECAISLPQSGAKYFCNPQTNDVLLIVKDYFGGISGEYQFGFDVNNAWPTPASVEWQNSNAKFISKGKSITVWIRDKNNTDCYTKIQSVTPTCSTGIPYPIIKVPSLYEIFSQQGNTLTGDIDNINVGDSYQVSYTYQGDSLETYGTVDVINKKISLPLSNKSGTIVIRLINTSNGQPSNIAYYNVINEEAIYFDLLENACQTNDANTYLHLKLRQTTNAKKYIVTIRDSVTSDLFSSNSYPVATDIYIKHLETNKSVTVQVTSEDDPLKGSLVKTIVLAQTNCTTSTCDCVQKLAYAVNSRGSGTVPDSIGIYYKGKCNKYKFYIESESNRGTYELYNDLSNSPQAEVSLASPYNEYNQRPIQAMGSRVWRDKGYKVKFEMYDNNAIVNTIEIVVDLTSATVLNTPIVKFECGSNSNNNCQLEQKGEIGYQTDSLRLQSRKFGDKWYPVTVDKNSLLDRFFPRGSNIVSGNVTITKPNIYPSCFDQNVTSFGGLTAPNIFRPNSGANSIPEGGNFVPSGYRRAFTNDGALYLEIDTTSGSYPCNQTPCVGYSGGYPTSGENYAKIIFERINNNVPNGAVGRVSTFPTRADAIRLIAAYAVDASYVDPNGYKVNFDNVNSINNGVFKQYFSIGDYLLNNNLSNDLAPSQCGFVIARVIEGGQAVPLTTKYDIITTNPCGQIIDIERYVIGSQTDLGGGGSTGSTNPFSIIYADANLGGGPQMLFRFVPQWLDDGSGVKLIKTDGLALIDGYQMYWTFDGDGINPDGSRVVNAYQGNNIDNIVFPPDYHVEIRAFFAKGPDVNKGMMGLPSNPYSAIICQAIVYTGNKPTNSQNI